MARLTTFERYTLLALENVRSFVELTTILLVILLRTPHAPYFALGMYVCGFGAKLLQRVLRQPRPDKTSKKSYGMPSAHASAIAFVGWYTALAAAFVGLHPRLRIAKLLATHAGPAHLMAVDILSRVAIAQGALVLAALVCWSRHHFSHHTPAQIIAGAIFGTACALVWFALWTRHHGAIDAVIGAEIDAIAADTRPYQLVGVPQRYIICNASHPCSM